MSYYLHEALYERCPQCDQPHPADGMDRHLDTVHADLPPCTARLDREDGHWVCVLRAGHKSAYVEHQMWHASERGPVGRTVWTDGADGATSHDVRCTEHDVNEWACVPHPQTGEVHHVRRARPGLRIDFTGSSLHGAVDPLTTIEETP